MKDGGVNVAKEVVEIKVAQRVDYWFHKRQTWIPGNIIFLSILVDLTCSTDERLLCEKLFTGALANCTNTGWAAGDPLVQSGSKSLAHPTSGSPATHFFGTAPL